MGIFGGGLLKEAEEKSKAAVACTDLDSIRPYIKWFNEQELKNKGAAVKALSPEDQAAYKAFSLAAADQQMKLRAAAAG